MIFTRRDKAGGDYKIEAVVLANARKSTLYTIGPELGYRVSCSKASGKIGFVYAGDIWLMEGNGMNVRKLTNGLQLPKSVKLGWSADGGRIFYLSDGNKGVKGRGIIELGATS